VNDVDASVLYSMRAHNQDVILYICQTLEESPQDRQSRPCVPLEFAVPALTASTDMQEIGFARSKTCHVRSLASARCGRSLCAVTGARVQR